jgi:hypothetical protein
MVIHVDKQPPDAFAIDRDGVKNESGAQGLDLYIDSVRLHFADEQDAAEMAKLILQRLGEPSPKPDTQAEIHTLEGYEQMLRNVLCHSGFSASEGEAKVREIMGHLRRRCGQSASVEEVDAQVLANAQHGWWLYRCPRCGTRRMQQKTPYSCNVCHTLMLEIGTKP